MERNSVLIVENGGILINTLSDIFEDYVVIRISSLEEARKAIGRHKGNLVLLVAAPATQASSAGRDVGNLTIERDLRKVVLRLPTGTAPLRLTPSEYKILLFLIDHADRIISRSQLMRLLRGKTKIAPRTVDAHMSNLRRKLAGSEYGIVTLYGSGYAFRKK